MFKIWAKLEGENKEILKDSLIKFDGRFEKELFFEYLTEISHKLDIATPNILTYHADNFNKFNFVKFTSRDFVESINFRFLVLESAKA